MVFLPSLAQASASKRTTLHLNDKIGNSPSRSTSMNLPIAVQLRLDEMADLADAVRPTRNELIAALVAMAELDAEVLEAVVLQYRRLKVVDVLPEREHVDDDVVVPLRQPGRPSRGGR